MSGHTQCNEVLRDCLPPVGHIHGSTLIYIHELALRVGERRVAVSQHSPKGVQTEKTDVTQDSQTFLCRHYFFENWGISGWEIVDGWLQRFLSQQ